MTQRLLSASLILATALAGCTSLRSKDATPAPAATPQPATAPANTDAASTQAANTGSNLSGSSLPEQKRTPTNTAMDALKQNTIHFDYDVATLRSEDFAILEAHARYLSTHAKAKVTLAGHTDERGTAEYNMALGERRAKAAQMYLLTHGAKPAQLDVVSFGEEKPVDTDQSEAAWAKNRRVELNYSNDAP